MTAITIEDLDNAKLDVDHIADIATSQDDTATDRLGHTKKTIAGAIKTMTALNPRGAWATSTAYSVKDIVTNGSIVYFVTKAHTSTSIAADLAAGNIAIYQGLTSLDLADPAQGDSLLAVLQNFTGAVATTQDEINNQRFSVFNAMNATQIADVKAGSFGQDVTAAINVAISAAKILGKRLFVPAGLYRVVPATAVTSEAGAETIAFPMASNMHIEAEPGAIFKLADNQSTDASPKALEMFFTNQVLSNVTFDGLTMDMNGANNKVSPGRPTVYDTGKNFAPICVSGTPGGVAARIDNVTIRNCKFLNNPGVCDIVVAQSNTAGVTLGKNWKILFNEFLNNGLDTNDHTCIFGWADDMLVFGNRFENDTPYGTVGQTGLNTGFEVHGTNHRIIGNKFKNCLRGAWVSSNYTSNVMRTIIAQNIFEPVFYGVDFFRTIGTLTPIFDTLIVDNEFVFDDTVVAAIPGLDFKAAVQVASDYAQQSITARGNRMRKSGTAVSSAFSVIVGSSVLGQVHTEININANDGVGMNFGNFVRTSATEGLGYLNLRGNNWVDLTPAGAFGIASGDHIDRTTNNKNIDALSLGAGTCIDRRGTPACNYGARINTGVLNLHVAPGHYKGMATADYLEDTNAIITNRRGTYENIAYTPVLTSGASTVSIGNGSLVASYSQQGDMVDIDIKFTVGSTTSFGGGGTLQFTVPFNARTVGHSFLGNWRIFNGSAFTLGAASLDGGDNHIGLNMNGGTNASNTAPVALAAGHTVIANIRYRRVAP